MIADKNYCYVCHVGFTYDEEKIKKIRKISDVTNKIFLKLKKIFSFVLTLNIGCITIEQVIEQDLVLANGIIFYLKCYIDKYQYRICWNDKLHSVNSLDMLTKKSDFVR